MKKCYYCGVELEEDCHFCTECGEELPDCTCPRCGADVWDGDNYCQNCGYDLINDEGVIIGEETDGDYNDVVEDEENKSRTKILLPVIIGGVLLALIGGGWYYLNSNKKVGEQETVSANNANIKSDSLIVDEDISDVHSEAYVIHRLQDICDRVPSTSRDELVNNYFSKSFRKLYKAVCDEYMKDREDDDIGYFGFYFWSYGNNIEDESIKSVKVLKVDNLTDFTAQATVQDYVKFSENDELKHSKQLKLVFENGDWFIDDLNDYKNSMQEYLSSSQEEPAESNTAIGAFNEEGDSIE